MFPSSRGRAAGNQNQAMEAFRGTHNVFRVAFTVISLNSIAIAHSATPYQAPAHNYYQNNWMAGD
jgi:hypothetical protein